MSKPVKIISAIYASPFSGGFDVTEEVQKIVNNGRNIFISFKTFGFPDPGPNQTKGFTAKYEFNGDIRYVGAKDGDTITIPF